MSTLARFAVGRVLLHMIAMVGDEQFRFHVAGILRELPPVGVVLTLRMRARSRMTEPTVKFDLSPPQGPPLGGYVGQCFQRRLRPEALPSDT
jgi:hypothetical protein